MRNQSNANDDLIIEDHYVLPHSRDEVWERLNDPEMLARCIKGCEQVERESAQKFRAVIRAKLGEMHKDFHVYLDVDDVAAPEAYGLCSQVNAGLFGKANAEAQVRLKEIDTKTTELRYVATITGTGLIKKSLPLIEGAARRRVHAFFDEFVQQLEALS